MQQGEIEIIVSKKGVDFLILVKISLKVPQTTVRIGPRILRPFFRIASALVWIWRYRQPENDRISRKPYCNTDAFNSQESITISSSQPVTALSFFGPHFLFTQLS